jgi:multiple sugar transport system ATP-binding protein
VLLGPTSAGKTTTLRCVAGLEKIDDGQVIMDGADITGLSPAERDMAFVFQSYALYPRKTTYENMAFPLEARRMTKQQIDSRVREIASLLQISELLERYPGQMSGGQQQRVALGRAMVRQPRLFLMDEPLTNLDFKLRVEMRAELKRLQRELAATFFYVTNDQVEAMTMADRIAVLDNGVLQQIGDPEEIYDHPANLFVAQFIGHPRMNTIPCAYNAADNTLHSDDGTWSLQLLENQQAALSNHTHDDLIFGIRAEDINVSLEEIDNAYAGEVYVIEPLGDRTYVDIRLGEYTLRARAHADFEAHTGQTVWMEMDIERIHVFDAADEETIF